MKTIFVLTLLFASTAHASSLDGRDKKLHFGVSSAGTFIGSHVLKEMGASKTEAIIASSVLVLLSGYLKELSDSRISDGDLRANALGVSTGALGAAISLEF